MGFLYTGTYATYATEADVLASNGKPGDIAYAADTDMRYKSNGTSWFPTDALRTLKGTTPVSLLSLASTKFLTLPPTAFRFIVIGVHIEILSLTGTVITQPTIAVGATSAAYADIATSSSLSGLMNTVGLASANALTLAAARAPLAGSTDVYAKVNLGAVGPTAYTARIDLVGYFET